MDCVKKVFCPPCHKGLVPPLMPPPPSWSRHRAPSSKDPSVTRVAVVINSRPGHGARRPATRLTAWAWTAFVAAARHRSCMVLLYYELLRRRRRPVKPGCNQRTCRARARPRHNNNNDNDNNDNDNNSIILDENTYARRSHTTDGAWVRAALKRACVAIAVYAKVGRTDPAYTYRVVHRNKFLSTTARRADPCRSFSGTMARKPNK